MNTIVVLAEERSGCIVVEALARNLGIGDRTLCLEHQGRSDLERSMARKLRGWGGAARFIVMRDNDGAVCRERKAALAALVPKGVEARVKIRIIMQELESWYLGDPQALCEAGLIDAQRARNWPKQAKFRNPDLIRHAKEQFRHRVAVQGQLELARLIGPRLKPNRNLSPSFHAFVGAMRWAAAAGA